MDSDSATRQERYQAILRAANGQPKTIGGKEQYIPATCPNGCANRPGHMKFSIVTSQRFDDAGSYLWGHCFSCGSTWNQRDLDYHYCPGQSFQSFSVSHQFPPPAMLSPQEVAPRPDPSWMAHAADYVRQYTAAPDAQQAWDAYKPIPRDVAQFYELGVGVLPASRCRQRRLIVPFVVGGEIVGFRGRRRSACHCRADPCATWLQSALRQGQAATLWNGASLLPDSTTGQLRGLRLARSHIGTASNKIGMLVENQIDALLLEVNSPVIAAFAPMSGAQCWNERWDDLFAGAGMSEVVVLYDNDHAGNPAATVRYQERHCDAAGRWGLYPYLESDPAFAERLIARWQAKHPHAPASNVPPIYRDPLKYAAGPRRFAGLVAAFWRRGILRPTGVPPVTYHVWPESASLGTDVGSGLI